MKTKIPKGPIYVVLETYDDSCPCACGFYNAYTHSLPLAKDYIRQVSDKLEDFTIYEIPDCKPEEIKDSLLSIYGIDSSDFENENEIYVSEFSLIKDCLISTTHLDQVISEMMNDPFEEIGLGLLSSIYNLRILSKYLLNNEDLLKLLSIVEFYTIRFILLDGIDLYDIREEVRKKFNIEESDFHDSSLDYNYIAYLLRDYYT